MFGRRLLMEMGPTGKPKSTMAYTKSQMTIRLTNKCTDTLHNVTPECAPGLVDSACAPSVRKDGIKQRTVCTHLVHLHVVLHLEDESHALIKVGAKAPATVRHISQTFPQKNSVWPSKMLAVWAYLQLFPLRQKRSGPQSLTAAKTAVGC